jgi:hypothetical protein
VYSINKETTKQTSDEARTMMEAIELMSFDPPEFQEIYSFLKTFTNHQNWRVRYQAIFSAGMISTRMCLDIDYEALGKDVYSFIYDDELRIR